ncbi:MAG: hypothetical protein QM831_44205 [Kofleriaceae bacterium]
MWVCIDCGNRQPGDGQCTACKHDPVLDLEDVRTREFMRDVDERLRVRRENRFRIVGVLIGTVIIVALWTQRFWWEARGKVYPGLPMLIDQFAMMIAIGFGVSWALTKTKLGKPRFPYLKRDLTIA